MAGITISLAAPGVLRAVTGAALYLTVVAILSSGLGWLLRSTAGALATLVGILVVPQLVALLLPPGIGEIVGPYLPGNAATAIMQLEPGAQLGPWTGLAVFLGYAAAVLAGAVLAVRRRDA
jgi:ABC-2 type transport system permease protein